MPSPTKRSESLQSLSNPNRTNGKCGRWYQETCFLVIATFLALAGGSLTFVAAFFAIRDLYVLGPAFLTIGVIMLIVGTVLLIKKVKKTGRVDAARREEGEQPFTNLRKQTEKRRFMPSFFKGYRGSMSEKLQKNPNVDDSHGKDKQTMGQNAITLTEMNYPFETMNGYTCPNVSFPRSSYTNLKTVVQGETQVDATFHTPLSRFYDSPKKAADTTSDIVPKLEYRTTGPSRSGSISDRRGSSCKLEIHTNVPPAASYTPVSLNKVELSDIPTLGMTSELKEKR